MADAPESKKRVTFYVLVVLALMSGALVVYVLVSRVTIIPLRNRAMLPALVIQPQAPQTEERCFLPSQDGAVVAGWVKYSGPAVTPVNPKALKTVEDKITAYTDSLVVNPNGTLCNVLVYIKAGLQSKSFAAPSNPLVMNATPIDFFPHVLAVQAGQDVRLRNCDLAPHNWDIRSITNPPRSIGQPKAGMELHHRFMVPEVPIPVSSAVYPYMSGYICVIGHPYFNVTNSGGVFRLEGLSPGTYVIESWHEKLGTKQQTVTVEERELVKVTIMY